MRRTQHIKKVLCDRLYTTGSQNEPDEVYPGIFIGDEYVFYVFFSVMIISVCEKSIKKLTQEIE